MDLLLKDKVAIVTGSSRGIGKSIARSLLSEGCKVQISGRQSSELKAAHLDLEKIGEVQSFSGDLLDPASIEKSIHEALKITGHLDILVLNIGSGKSEKGWQISNEEWLRVWNLNFLGAYQFLRSSVPHLSKQKKGSVIFVSSIAGIEAHSAPLPYSAAKAALIDLSKNLSRELAPLGVRVNSVAPGNIFCAGGTWDQKMKEDPQKVQSLLNQVPLKRFGKPEEIGDAVAFLASERSAFTTGSCFVIDGGETKSF